MGCGCFGGGSSDSGFGCEWLIILAIIFFCFCNGSSGFFSDLFEDCDWLIWLAIILLLLFLCNCGEESCD